MIDIRSRKIIANVKGKEIPFEEYYAFDLETNEEMFERNLELKNDLRLYDLYKESEGLLTSSDIKKIRNKYQMNQKEFALALGMGEITIHRFENGSIQTEAIDSVIRLSDDPKIMNNFLVKNKDSFEETDYKRLMDNVSDLIKLSEHKVALFNKKDFAEYNFETSDALLVADYLINVYNEKVHNTFDKVDIDEKEFYITPLKLQKLLYYIQGLSSVIYEKPAFDNKIVCWSYGPVINDVYNMYKGRKPIHNASNKNNLSVGLKKIIDLIIDSYGEYDAEKLIKLTHDEEPWKNADINCVIKFDTIKKYFEKVYK